MEGQAINPWHDHSCGVRRASVIIVCWYGCGTPYAQTAINFSPMQPTSPVECVLFLIITNCPDIEMMLDSTTAYLYFKKVHFEGVGSFDAAGHKAGQESWNRGWVAGDDLVVLMSMAFMQLGSTFVTARKSQARIHQFYITAVPCFSDQPRTAASFTCS